MFTVYVLSLLYIDGYYVGFSSDFAHRLSTHVLGEGARITKRFGVCAIRYTEEVETVEAAKHREHELTQRLLHQGAVAWGGNLAWRNPKTAEYLAKHPSPITDPNAPPRHSVRLP